MKHLCAIILTSGFIYCSASAFAIAGDQSKPLSISDRKKYCATFASLYESMAVGARGMQNALNLKTKPLPPEIQIEALRKADERFLSAQENLKNANAESIKAIEDLAYQYRLCSR